MKDPSKTVLLLVAFAATLGLIFLASFYWERSVLPEVKFLGYSETLDKESYEGSAVGGLSGLTYDPGQDLYYSVADKGVGSTPARFYEIRLPVDLEGFYEDPTISGVTDLHDSSGQKFTGEDFDAEGIAVTSDGQQLLVADETKPSILRFSREGDLLAELPVPQRFLVEPEGEAQANATFESLSLSPDGQSLFTANELPLDSDGQDSDKHNRLRLLEYENREGSSSEFVPSREFFYLTDPREGPGQSVNDVAALSDRELLVLEDRRKVFRVLLGEGQEQEQEDVSDVESLASSSVAPLDKELLVDLSKCPLPSSGSDNAPPSFEGLAVGPELADGGRVLMVQSDDNFTGKQKTILSALKVRLPQDSSPLKGSRACE